MQVLQVRKAARILWTTNKNIGPGNMVRFHFKISLHVRSFLIRLGRTQRYTRFKRSTHICIQEEF